MPSRRPAGPPAHSNTPPFPTSLLSTISILSVTSQIHCPRSTYTHPYHCVPSLSLPPRFCMAHWHKGAILVSGALIAPETYSAAGGVVVPGREVVARVDDLAAVAVER